MKKSAVKRTSKTVTVPISEAAYNLLGKMAKHFKCSRNEVLIRSMKDCQAQGGVGAMLDKARAS